MLDYYSSIACLIAPCVLTWVGPWKTNMRPWETVYEVVLESQLYML